MDFEDLDSASAPGSINIGGLLFRVREAAETAMYGGREGNEDQNKQSNSKVQWPKLHIFQGNNMANLRKAMLLELLRLPKGPTSDGRRIYSKDDMPAHS